MNVLLIAPQPFFQERGTPIAVRLLAETLCEFGHRVDLLVFHEGEDVGTANLRVVRARRPPGVGRVPIGISVPKLACDVMLVWRMLGLLRRNRYHVIHAVEEAIFPAVVVSRYAGARLVYDMDSSLADQLTDKWRWLRALRGLLVGIERFAVRRATATVAVCEDLAAKVRPWIGADRVVVLPDVPLGDGAVGEVECLRTLAGGRDAVLALYVGNLENYQGIDLLLDALAAVPREVPLRTVVIGGLPADVERYRRRAVELGLNERVTFPGARPVARLGSYLAQADVLLSPRTLGRNTPMKLYSYMQAGRAILATDIRSHTQALDSSCASLAPPRPEAFAAALQALCADAALRARLGAAARERAERDYSLATYRRTLRALYDRLAEER
ncbi:MAG: glycosyltransferase family 4 protein [Steroidobacteraceae bacterium]|jgi:glycosyltransferase involved in cell wall biosynthesis|nr:glycosyltransferase family 4 protein [Steroidobacteraceae bacterium]